MDHTTTLIKYIRVNDGNKFRRIVDVMNSCFGKHYEGCQKAFYIDDSQKYAVWFPKIAIKKKGKYKAYKGWLNILSDDGETIIEKREDIKDTYLPPAAHS